MLLKKGPITDYDALTAAGSQSWVRGRRFWGVPGGAAKLVDALAFQKMAGRN